MPQSGVWRLGKAEGVSYHTGGAWGSGYHDPVRTVVTLEVLTPIGVISGCRFTHDERTRDDQVNSKFSERQCSLAGRELTWRRES